MDRLSSPLARLVSVTLICINQSVCLSYILNLYIYSFKPADCINDLCLFDQHKKN